MDDWKKDSEERWSDERRMDGMQWGPGPWMDEPDRIDWHYKGLPCKIQRNPQIGNLCGYVGVAPGHPWFRMPHHEIPAEVHGSLSYGQTCEENPHICHVPQPGEPDHVYWIGFDCAHGFDFTPSRSDTRFFNQDPLYVEALKLLRSHESYKTVAYVRSEVEQLADQVINAQGGQP